MCEYHFKGATSSEPFVCIDKYANDYGQPSTDGQNWDNVVDVSTNKLVYTSENPTVRKITLEATFERLLQTGDTTYDYQMLEGQRIVSIWAMGSLLSSNPDKHGDTD